MADELQPDDTETQGNGATQLEVTIQKLYIKDASIEVPSGPMIFTEDQQPEVNVDLNTEVQQLTQTAYEVLVTVTIKATQGEQTSYIVEVQQAGVFEVGSEANEEERGQLLGAYCPAIVFPYLREAAGDMVQRAGFPHFALQPVNFEALYAQHLAEQAGQTQNANQVTH